MEVKTILFSPGIEPGTFCVLDRCDNHYTTKTAEKKTQKLKDKPILDWESAINWEYSS